MHQVSWILIACNPYQQVGLNSVPELLEDIIHPAAFDSRVQVSEDIGEMREQLRKQASRLRELRVKKIEEPGYLFLDMQGPNTHDH